ncbi:helix-turn-helix transcriptional regulator [Acidihalobacter aeolianus]|uniref:helix-turn-helix transcriptional regulator n=1 Tax=Acidihalobacter aeolianus TaxID=2792603 RepID=UPI0009F58388|nr:hypothetical protein [Acidihalobacter aeolianus]
MSDGDIIAEPIGHATKEETTTNKRVFSFWDDLSDFGPESVDDAMHYCMGRLSAWIGAQNAYWIGTIRMVDGRDASLDALSGWRLRALHTLYPHLTHPRRLKQARKVFDSTDPGMSTLAALASAGQFRSYSLGTGMLDLEQYRQTDHYDYFYRKPGICDRIWVVFPVNVDAESCFCFDRIGDDVWFSAEDIEVVTQALRGIKWFHRQLLLSHGLGLASEKLMPAERRMAQALLSGASEKVIAERLGLTPASAHQYASMVYRKYGVRGRSEFMSLWVNNRF